jgi:hypothetical protein
MHTCVHRRVISEMRAEQLQCKSGVLCIIPSAWLLCFTIISVVSVCLTGALSRTVCIVICMYFPP